MCLPSEYFTNYTARKAILYLFAAIYVICCGVVSIFEPFLIQYAKVDCPIEHDRSKGYLNASYDTNPCMETHLPILLYFTPKQCSFGRRIVIATLLGGLIGWERRNADRPAGIRTMSLVSLGSCLFSICSAFAFANGPENWDGSRVAAAIPSGVGFLGAGLIYKEVDNQGGGTAQQVHGLTTAASLWLSAAVVSTGAVPFLINMCKGLADKLLCVLLIRVLHARENFTLLLHFLLRWCSYYCALGLAQWMPTKLRTMITMHISLLYL